MGGRKWPWAVLLVLVLVAGATVTLTLAGEDGGRAGGPDGRRPASTVKEELLKRVRPRPSCPISEPRRAPGKDEKMVAYATVEDACLVVTTEIVPADEAEARVVELRARDDVVAADVERERPAVPSGVSAGASGAADGLPWQYERLQGAEIERRWPPDAPEVTVAVIDTGINENDPALADTVITKAPWTQPAKYKEEGHGR